VWSFGWLLLVERGCHHHWLVRPRQGPPSPARARLTCSSATASPSPSERGFYLACWQTAKASGPIVGGAINLGLNINRNGAGSVGCVPTRYSLLLSFALPSIDRSPSSPCSSATYIVFIVIMCLGFPIALLLSPAEKVWRKDGTRVIIRKEVTWWAEFTALGRLMVSKRIILLYPGASSSDALATASAPRLTSQTPPALCSLLHLVLLQPLPLDVPHQILYRPVAGVRPLIIDLATSFLKNYG
jgi:hypothetical protein